LLSACGGGGPSQDANEPSGNFPVQAAATFPNAQRLAQHSRMVVVVHNTGNKTIPNVAVTICNVTCAYPAPRGQGSAAGAFAADISQEGVANPSRPIWIVDTPLGALAPGKTATFVWRVTAVQPGVHTVAWEVAAGLNGKAKAVQNGTIPRGKITVLVRKAPAKTYVTNSGKVVSQQ